MKVPASYMLSPVRPWLRHALVGLALKNSRPAHRIGSAYLTLNVGTAGRLFRLLGHLMRRPMWLLARVAQEMAIPACRVAVSLHAHAFPSASLLTRLSMPLM